MPGKYPSPAEAAELFRTGVEAATGKWRDRTVGGVPRYQTWFTGFANTIYPVIARLPDRATLPSIRDRVNQRVAPVAEAIHELSVSYRQTKLQQLARAVVR